MCDGSVQFLKVGLFSGRYGSPGEHHRKRHSGPILMERAVDQQLDKVACLFANRPGSWCALLACAGLALAGCSTAVSPPVGSKPVHPAAGP